MSAMTAEFDSYLRACYGESKLHPGQYAQVRQAFFAGAHSAISKVVAIPHGGGTDDEQEQRLQNLISDVAIEGRPPNTKAN